MNDYIKPSLSEEEFQMESIYAASGSNDAGDVPPVVPEIPDTPEWSHSIEWTNHNGGSHSDVGIRLSRSGEKMCQNFEIQMITTFPIGTISNLSTPGSGTVTYSDYSINISVSNWTINPTQNGFISFQITDKNSLNGGSYYPSGTHLNETAPQFTVTKCEGR